MGPTTATVAEPVLFLQPTYAGAQESETNGSWANAGAFCAGAAVAAGAVALAAAQPKSAVQTPTRREQRAALRAARNAALEMTVTADASSAVLILSPPSVMVASLSFSCSNKGLSMLKLGFLDVHRIFDYDG